ncbi:AfsR/SARP family transcriptional regulator [Streptomyces synnematoformans]|uniref:Uncharacterized protein n=1 Tax=Streptomyces synnematoformans TaxID=415721 RepID=A0ABP5IVL6_9ACTN
MEIEVLGGLEVRRNGRSIVPSGSEAQQVLALLAARADQVVPMTSLICEIWQDTPPHDARRRVEALVCQLRKRLAAALQLGGEPAAAASSILVSVPGGVLLDSRCSTVDFRAFQRSVGAGLRLLEAGRVAEAARRLRDALDLWRGPVFAGVRQGPYLEAEARPLKEARLGALDQWAEAELRLGRQAELVPELTLLTGRHRTDEGLHGKLMTALHRCGRSDEALAVYNWFRAALAREHGTEPSDRLGRIRHGILLEVHDTKPTSLLLRDDFLLQVA